MATTPATPSPFIGKWATHPTKQNYRRSSWKSGPDDLTHEQYYAWSKHRSQAAYRSESHELSFEQWLGIWNINGNWANRGRQPECVCLCRRDPELPWRINNVEIISRYEQLCRQAQARVARGTRYRTRRDKGVKRGTDVT